MFLIYDPEHRGHHGEFLENLIYGLRDVAGYVMCASPRLRARLEKAKDHARSDLRIEYLDEDWTERLLKAHGLLKRGRLETEMALRLVDDLGATHLLLMQMNMNQFYIGLKGRQIPCVVSGIVLNHYTPLSRAHTFIGKMKAWGTGARKLLMYRWLIRGGKVEHVFILNDPKVADDLNRHLRCGKVFKSVIDPLPHFTEQQELSDGISKRATLGKSDKTVFLLAGSLAPRKGCLELLSALQALPNEMTSRLKLRILGHFRTDSYLEEVGAAVRELLKRRPEMEIEIHPEFLSNEDFLGALRNCDFVLAPYLNFYGSSGILAHACAAGKPLLACRDGWLGERVRELRVGATFNPLDVHGFAEVLTQAIQGELAIDFHSAQEYVAQASLTAFCEALTEKVI